MAQAADASTGGNATAGTGALALVAAARLPNVLLLGTGEYTTGCVDAAASTSDKPMGVVALTFFDLRARGLVGPRIALCGRRAARNANIRSHFQATIAKMYNLDCRCELYPSGSPGTPDVDPLAYVPLLNGTDPTSFQAGDLACITTPDDEHANMALKCIARGVHCIVAKPVVQSLEEHWKLLKAVETYDQQARAAAEAAKLPMPRPLVVVGEYHKRFDPLYADAVGRIASGSLGHLSFFNAYMSQPKSQLQTFRAWLVGAKSEAATTCSGSSPCAVAARAAPSDISFYLNSHHLDILHLSLCAQSRPLWVTAIAAKGLANEMLRQEPTPAEAAASATATPAAAHLDIEDTITVTVQYAHDAGRMDSAPTGYGIGLFTSSWIAPRGDVHTQQRFHFLGTAGELSVDQAHRGYHAALDAEDPTGARRGVQSLNPLFMRYVPSVEGRFVGQQGYGYRSFEHFVEAACGRPSTAFSPLAHLRDPAVLFTTAVLQAARRSLDQGNRKVNIVYDAQRRPTRVE